MVIQKTPDEIELMARAGAVLAEVPTVAITEAGPRVLTARPAESHLLPGSLAAEA
ncbi:hypothetical protein [Micromonospora inositola]|uniref:Uncharacterized protein n=1 Tax=Micromonospora inositola TaxID=47865 RepID=A0A1C5H8M4_9ACTN|nr:hypothetical protein [Micromonospora inositola]SCG42247.1 hypothetical protein GA0070613_0964 [Micromonospora inositola]